MRQLFFLFVLIGITSCMQAQSGWKKVQITSDHKFEILNEDHIYDMGEVDIPNDTIRCSIIIDTGQSNPYPDSLTFSSANLKDKTLTVSLTSVAGHTYHDCIIRIVDQKFMIHHKFLVDIFEEEDFNVLDPVLKLSSTNFTKGGEIRGYIEYKLITAKPSENFKDTYAVRGNFKATIR